MSIYSQKIRRKLIFGLMQCTFEEVPNENNVSTILELAILAFSDRPDIIDNGKSLDHI